MRFPTTPDSLRRRRLIAFGAAIVLLMTACITHAVLVHRSASSSAGNVFPHPNGGGTTVVETQPTAVELPALRPTSDSEIFARQVAEALFEWDTGTLISRTDHVEQLVAVADPTGESTPGLVSDLDNYLPTQDAWVELAQYETLQWLSIDSVATPSMWAEAENQAGDELLPGTTAFTIHGTRHRSGIWEDEPVASGHDVAFTVFIVCGPSYPECHLLRLSMLDKPLD
ncbi:conserved exported hypothetical protein [metagenome]|uniref:Uncharacterized protein n=1 Tax=metagenome TaxID=256318 RepID=A0A2P2C7Z7_9ZZZZ